MDAATVLALHQLLASQPWMASTVAFVAEAGFFALPAALLVVWIVARAPGDRRREAVLTGSVTAVVAVCVSMVLGSVVSRPRPFVALGFEPLFPHSADSSFPSDHALVGVGLVAPMLWRARRLGFWLCAWALVVGFARVSAGVHYPTDILGSAFLALALAALTSAALEPAWRRLNLQWLGVARPGSPPGGRRR